MTRYPPASASDELLSRFFLEPANYAEQPQERVFLAVGLPADHDDWDWGRLVYCWRGSTIWVRATMQGGVVSCVELIEAGNVARFADALEVLWERPSKHDTESS